jgi:hypothetical protein
MITSSNNPTTPGFIYTLMHAPLHPWSCPKFVQESWPAAHKMHHSLPIATCKSVAFYSNTCRKWNGNLHALATMAVRKPRFPYDVTANVPTWRLGRKVVKLKKIHELFMIPRTI